MIGLVIIADDLTGSADAAAPFAPAFRTSVLADPGADWPPAEVLAVNTESRYLPETAAATIVADVVSTASLLPRAVVFKKIDSLLRGNTGAEIAALLRTLRTGGREPLAIVAPAFPRTGRTTRGGVVHVAGGSRGESGDVGLLLAGSGLSHRVIARGEWTDADDLCAAFVAAREAGSDAVVADAETDSDLALIAEAAAFLGRDAVLVGSGGIAAAVAASMTRRRDRSPSPVDGPEETSREAHALVVIGSYAPTSAAQLDALVERGYAHIRLDHPATQPTAAVSPEIEVSGTISALRESLRRGHAVLTPDPAAPVEKRRATSIAAALARTVASAATDATAIIVSGGETASAILRALDAPTLHVHGELFPGIVLSAVPGIPGPFVTKSGGFGDPAALTAVIDHLEQSSPATEVGAAK